MSEQKIIMVYGKTNYTPGRYLEDGLRSIGLKVDLYKQEIDFSKIDISQYMGVLFVESPSQPPVQIKNIHLVQIPKLFWVHHGENRLETNIQLAKNYKPDLVLMAHSLHLANKFPAPVRFFSFAMASDIFNCSTSLKSREYDISFVGSTHPQYYQQRTEALKLIRKQFGLKYNLSLDSSIFLHDLNKLYGNTKIVINHTADQIKSLNMRIFEGISCGALLLTDYVPGQEKLFDDKKHYVIYKNHHDLIEKIEYYLNHIEEAQQIATRGYQYLQANHTYLHRAQEIVDIIQTI